MSVRLGLGADDTVEAALRRATAMLRAAAVAAPRGEARHLLARALDGGMAQVVGYPERRLSAGETAAFEAMLARRARREPLARILGEREFWSLPFRLGPETLEPRADSETLVAALLARLGERGAPRRLLDLGTGTGCLLLALLSELPAARGLGIDISAGALATAAENAARLGLAERAGFRTGDWTAGLDERFDAIVSNPPYIEREAIAGLAPEVSLFDPALALDGGPDGLAAYRRIVPALPGLLRPGGWVALEIGVGQAEAVSEGLRAAGLSDVEAVADLSGTARCLLARAG